MVNVVVQGLAPAVIVALILMSPKTIRELANAYGAIKRVNFETKEKRHCNKQ